MALKTLQVFYNQNQSVPTNPSFSPSAGKPALIANLFSKNPNVEIVSDFLPLTREQLKIAHEPAFVDGVLDCRLSNGFNNTLPEIAASLPWNNGSFYYAAEQALKHRTVTMSPTSGFHHAEYRKAEGFCTFNGLMITAMLLKQKFNLNKITIIDFDAHYGNGADEIIHDLQVTGIVNYTFGAFADKLWLKGGGGAFDAWLDELKNGKLRSLVEGSDIILYQAGVDPHEKDPYGGYLSTEQMRLRDQLVFEETARAGVPVVWNLAGGYQTPIEKVLSLHNNTLLECLKAYGVAQ